MSAVLWAACVAGDAGSEAYVSADWAVFNVH